MGGRRRGGKSGGRVGGVEREVNLDHPIKRDNIFMAKATPNTRFSLKFLLKLSKKKKRRLTSRRLTHCL
jgi:hypothetical protein